MKREVPSQKYQLSIPRPAAKHATKTAQPRSQRQNMFETAQWKRGCGILLLILVLG
jgi:hypothetical protein